MWTVIKFDKNQLKLFEIEFKKKFKNECKIYFPKLLTQKIKKNKKFNKEYNLLGDYCFCFHNSFVSSNTYNQIKFLKGVKSLLTGYQNSQRDIIKFIYDCKKLENKEGYISQTIYKAEINKLYKFTSGPFSEKIFKIIELQKNKIEILMGNIKTSIGKKNLLFCPL